MMRSLIAVFLLVSAWVSAAWAVDPPIAEREWTVDGVARKALVYSPPTATKEPTPVVFAFHGHGGTMAHAARTFAYHKHWPKAIVVYMQGLNTPGRLTDPEGKKSGWQPSLGEQQDRDLKFFDSVLASLKSDYQVDARRVYATGHSNGGGFTYLLWANRGDTFAAVAPSGAIPSRGSKELKPKPVLHVAGEQDALVKFAWQKRAVDLVKKSNGCDAEGAPWAKAGTLTGTQYPSKTGTPLVSVTYPGGHQFPAEAPELITKFFQEHAKK